MTNYQSNNSLHVLLNAKLKAFVTAFRDDSRQLFVDTEGKLIHSGEFGTYREAKTREFLRMFIPKRMSIDTGFVVNAHGAISTQCDIVVVDTTVAPVLESENHQKFFPIESVCAIGEVKSVMSLAQVKSALLKLASVKYLRETIQHPTYIYCSKENGLDSKYEPNLDPRDHIISFLICESFSFDLADNANELLGCYVEDHPKRPSNLRHNFIVSLNDGLLTYAHPKGGLFPFPGIMTIVGRQMEDGTVAVNSIVSKRTNNMLIMPQNGSESVEHLRQFSTMFHQGLSAVSVLFPDMGLYIPSQDDVQFMEIQPS